MNRFLAPVLALLAFSGTYALGAIAVTMTEVGSDVVIRYTGSMDTTDMTFLEGTSGCMSVTPDGSSICMLNPGEEEGYWTHAGIGHNVWIVAPTTFGMGGTTVADMGYGDSFAFSGVYMQLPVGYVSGAPISGGVIFRNKDFDSLGIDAPVNMTATAGSGDTVTLATVPEPATMSLLAVGGIGLLRRKRKK